LPLPTIIGKRLLLRDPLLSGMNKLILPYVPLSECERSRWTTLAAVIWHIQINLGCAVEVAVRELRVAMGQGSIPARWAFGLSGVSQFEQPPGFSVDSVPADPFYWGMVLIFTDEDGAVVDQPIWRDSTTAPRRRGLFLLRSRVVELWHSPKKEKKRTSVKQIRNEARKLYPEGKFGPNENQAEQLIRKALLGNAPRAFVRRVLEEPEFATRRRPRGKQAKI
jgi:hypothetical protein